MLQWLSESVADWMAARRQAKARREFERGFAYAAGELLRGASASDLDDEIDLGFGPDAFDDGVEAAIVNWGQHVSYGGSPLTWPKIAAKITQQP